MKNKLLFCLARWQLRKYMAMGSTDDLGSTIPGESMTARAKWYWSRTTRVMLIALCECDNELDDYIVFVKVIMMVASLKVKHSRIAWRNHFQTKLNVY